MTDDEHEITARGAAARTAGSRAGGRERPGEQATDAVADAPFPEPPR